MFTNDTQGIALRARANAYDPLDGIGEAVHKTKCLLKAVYDFSVLGGATVNLVDDAGNPAILPKGAIVTNVVVNCLTAVTAVGAATVALQLLVANDLLTATAKASLASGFVAGAPVGTAATWVGPVTATAGTVVQAVIATGPLTAGKFQAFIEYVIQ